MPTPPCHVTSSTGTSTPSLANSFRALATSRSWFRRASLRRAFGLAIDAVTVAVCHKSGAYAPLRLGLQSVQEHSRRLGRISAREEGTERGGRHRSIARLAADSAHRRRT